MTERGHCKSMMGWGQAAPLVLCCTVVLVAGCATAGPTAVSPDEIPSLLARIQAEQSNGDLRHRYAAALYAADRCEEAIAVAREAMAIRSNNVVGPLVIGRCFEADGRYDEALQVYTEFRNANPEVSGTSALAAQQRLAAQARAIQFARAAIERDATGALGETDPQAVAILPLLVAGDSSYAPLSRGLASIIISDLNLLQRFRLLERLELNAIMDELRLGQSEVVDPQTAARVGRIIRAGRTVQGTANVAVEDATLLSAAVISDLDLEPASVEVRGRLEGLLDMEKQLVFGLSEAMGYTPTLAERTIIEENGTRNLLAFIAFSRGLEAEDNGDYEAARLHFQEALSRDPGFTQAGAQLEVVSALAVVASVDRTQVTTLATRADDAVGTTTGQAVTQLGATISLSVIDIAGMDSERVTQPASQNVANQIIDVASYGTTTGTITIRVVIP